MLERHGATVERLLDGRVMGVFGVPAAHEDDALRAVRAAVELREALADVPTWSAPGSTPARCSPATRLGRALVTGAPSTRRLSRTRARPARS